MREEASEGLDDVPADVLLALLEAGQKRVERAAVPESRRRCLLSLDDGEQSADRGAADLKEEETKERKKRKKEQKREGEREGGRERSEKSKRRGKVFYNRRLLTALNGLDGSKAHEAQCVQQRENEKLTFQLLSSSPSSSSL